MKPSEAWMYDDPAKVYESKNTREVRMKYDIMRDLNEAQIKRFMNWNAWRFGGKTYNISPLYVLVKRVNPTETPVKMVDVKDAEAVQDAIKTLHFNQRMIINYAFNDAQSATRLIQRKLNILPCQQSLSLKQAVCEVERVLRK